MWPYIMKSEAYDEAYNENITVRLCFEPKRSALIMEILAKESNLSVHIKTQNSQ